MVKRFQQCLIIVMLVAIIGSSWGMTMGGFVPATAGIDHMYRLAGPRPVPPPDRGDYDYDSNGLGILLLAS